MDIAEIRKKAKGRKGVQEEVADAVQVPAAGSLTPHEPPEAAQDVGRALVSVRDEDETSSSALDRLFAATEAYALATDDSYADILEAQVDAGTLRQYLAFHLGDEEYALDITRISEIIKVREFTDIPRAPEFILGIISLRGVVVPIFDLRRRLNLGTSELQSSSRIVVSQLDEFTVGLLVDRINQVINLADDELEPPPGVLSGLDRDMVSGIGRCDGRMIILLNLQNVLNVELS